MNHTEIIRSYLMSYSIRYFVVRTKFTEHHVEKLMASCKDRGTIKWIAETNIDAWEAVKNGDKEAQTSSIDGADLFPRLYFYPDSFVAEFMMWLRVRGLEITDIEVPKI